MKKSKQVKIMPKVIQNMDLDYVEKLNEPKYSLNIDTENKYNFNEVTKIFIKNYIQTKDIKLASSLSNLNVEDGFDIFKRYEVQNEIRRLSCAIAQRKFLNKMLTLDELGGYLSSMLTEEYNQFGMQLSIDDKTKIINTLLKIIEMKQNAIDEPATIISEDLDTQLKNLSVNTIKNLLNEYDENDKKNEIINSIDSEHKLTKDELESLYSMSVKDLLNFIDDISLKRRKK